MAERDLEKITYCSLISRYSAGSAYPQGGDEELHILLDAELSKSKRKVIVLDDDPTGVQTVHGVPVYTGWKSEDIEAGFDEDHPLFFILTNSRGMTARDSSKVHSTIGRTIAAAAKLKNRDFILVSRSDSTLRGHYPLETLALKESLESEMAHSGKDFRFDGEIICPFFPEGGRFTAGNIHYVKTNDTLVPAAQTEFAADKTFGYSHSDLAEWVEEKTRGVHKKETVIPISLELLRDVSLRPDERIRKISSLLYNAENFRKVIVNALDYSDIMVFSAAFYRTLDMGKRFILRSAAALPRVLGGIRGKPLLTREDLLGKDHEEKGRRGGLIVIGSHVQKTSRQLEILLEKKNIVSIEFNTHLVTDEVKFAGEMGRVLKLCSDSIDEGKTTVVYTSRNRFDLNTGNSEDELRISMKIAGAVTGIVSGLTGRPRFIIAKGGITSSEIGTIALGVKKAMVLGQVLPGIPVWLTGKESRFPGMPYIIFPGNVGDEGDLRKIVDMLEEED